MSRPALSAHLKLFKANRHDFPWKQVVQALLPIAEQFILCCPPEDDDGTRADCEEMARNSGGQIELHLMDWWKPEERGWESLADVVNQIIPLCRGRYHLNIEADEVVHENDLPKIQAICEEGRWDWVELERLNMWGSFDLINANRDRWPCSVVRLAKTDLFPIIRSYGDACHLGILDVDHHQYPRLDARDQIQLWHYAYVRPPRIIVERHLAMAKLYGLGPDERIMRALETGTLDWWGIVPKEEFVPIPACGHPAVMTEWIAQRRAAVESGSMDHE